MSATKAFAEEIADLVIARIKGSGPGKALLGIQETAEYLDCSVQQVRNFTESGRLTVVKIDSRARYAIRDLEKFVETSKR